LRSSYGFFAVLRRAAACDVTRAGDSSDVRLLTAPARRPQTQIERLLVDTLAVKGPMSQSALVSLAALAMYREELANGGSLVDLGFFGERLFVGDVTRALEAGRGVLWEFEPGVARRPNPEARARK
jgi:hypothetical protein